MPIVRADRDRLAAVVASELRRQQDDSANDLEELEQSADALVKQTAQEFLHSLKGPPGADRSRECWERLCRILAFLSTDREPALLPTAPTEPDGYDELDGFRARRHLIALFVCCALYPLLGWWPLGVCWVGSFLLVAIIPIFRWNWPTPESRAFDRASKQWRDVYPFTDEADWKGNERLLELYQLPSYESVHPPMTLWQKIALIPVVALCWSVLGSCFATILIAALGMFVLSWPIFLVVNALLHQYGGLLRSR
jgi:hypothetical protein